jgi:hypothetical protein
MKFAKIVFWISGVFGVLALAPLYFLFDIAGRLDPPPITHPQFYYGFVGVALAFQFVYFVIATDPVRYRPIMIPGVLGKLSFAGALLVLGQQGRVAPAVAMTGIPDALLAVLFLIAFFKTRAIRP